MPQTKDQKRRKAIDRHTKYAEHYTTQAHEYNGQLGKLKVGQEMRDRITKLRDGALHMAAAHQTIVLCTKNRLGRGK